MAAPDVFSKDTMTLNMKWKGKTFQELCSGIRYNTYNPQTVLSPKLFLKALPLKIYRREIANINLPCNPRTSLLKQFDNPGQTIVTPYSTTNGLKTTLDFNYENNSCQHPSSANLSKTTCIAFQTKQDNALRRVRSSGMIRKKNDNGSNNDNYYTDNKQYLTSRNRTFQQNQYFHIRQGNASAIPGTLAAVNNIYSSNGANHCPKFQVTSEIIFSYNWIDPTANPNTFDIVIKKGSYDIIDFNNVLQSAMLQNNHYFVNNITNTPLFLLQFIYNSSKNCIEFNSLSTTIYQIGTYYDYPNIYSWTFSIDKTPQVILPDNPFFQKALGFSSGTYPNSLSNTTTQVVYGTPGPLLYTNYVPIYYKPNNPQFGKQGAVSSGDLITRKRYNTINTAGSTFRTAFGKQTASAVAYGVPQYGYTSKDRVGFNLINTPVVSKYNGKLKKCQILRTLRSMRNG
jgi:hypothetical protein